jgi:hypothetical protein
MINIVKATTIWWLFYLVVVNKTNWILLLESHLYNKRSLRIDRLKPEACFLSLAACCLSWYEIWKK